MVKCSWKVKLGVNAHYKRSHHVSSFSFRLLTPEGKYTNLPYTLHPTERKVLIQLHLITVSSERNEVSKLTFIRKLLPYLKDLKLIKLNFESKI